MSHLEYVINDWSSMNASLCEEILDFAQDETPLEIHSTRFARSV